MEKNFLNCAKKFHECHLKNQIKSANKYAKTMHSILNDVIKTPSYKQFLDNILLSENNIALIWACTVCIEQNYRKEDAIAILQTLSSSKDEIVSRDAYMVLAVNIN